MKDLLVNIIAFIAVVIGGAFSIWFMTKLGQLIFG